ncbi:5-dehydro-4-deoxyglucarate dehydratase [Larsenimonas rhizosphaerae]|uniref:Probable 5-dehydro-4-deoxyglucarate dehydratase n=1 Tax=Larsenimonas rhizosphaerae TaxID=2944682 RepID=A0AA41ZFM4_9GAMM|nr:5-dehydro-4-deoxyglucarate dehydratase [Larsenimonas rhizosphaerae]MCX2524417.1 5-dehydro-4-deoxyglucarate dehydratase [Larsenimonas rhizosphaerae]
MAFSRQAVTDAVGDGLLSFPVTDFDANGNFDAASYRARIEWLLKYEISTLFVAGGTGEFFNLSLDEFREIVTIAVEATNGRVPVIASAGMNAHLARQYARIAEEAGADGILLMPPYLTECPQSGLFDYARSVCGSTDLNVIYYNRANGLMNAETVKALADACPNLIGVKDGRGDIQALNTIIKTVGDRLVYVGGVPTAEIFAEAYLSIGVNTYSSAVFNFVPEMAVSFYKALRAGDSATVARLTREFFIPFVQLRDTCPGYAVSLVKAGAALVGHSGGDVRSPLTMPSADETKRLQALIDHVAR